jgi:truncated hemoglobin YjbI
VPSQRDKPVDVSDLFEPIGGSETCRCLSDAFHERVMLDAVLRKIFPKNMAALTERFALFLGERLGGPPAYTAQRGKQNLVCRHAHLSISTDEADRWLGHMFAAMDEVGIAEPARVRLRQFFTETALTLTDPYIPLYRLPLTDLSAQIRENPGLLKESSTGHSLLREAVCRWDSARVRLLLEAGANANLQEPLGHGPLYRATNAVVPWHEAEGREVVLLLIEHGADVNRQSGPVKTTPLHMTARRGHVFLAEILLAAGADIEARDSEGETPLRRAVNCGQEPMVRFLLSRGANPVSRDKRGRTPIDVVRHEPIRQTLVSRPLT